MGCSSPETGILSFGDAGVAFKKLPVRLRGELLSLPAEDEFEVITRVLPMEPVSLFLRLKSAC